MMQNTLYHIGLLDDLARKDTAIHRLHPLVKVIATIFYLGVIASFSRYEVTSLLPLVLFPAVILAGADLPVGSVMKRVALVQPLIIGIGILNPLFDQIQVSIGSIVIAQGWITFFSLMIKGWLTVSAGLLLIATTGMDKLAGALRLLKVPKLFVLQLLLTYRYIAVLLDEAARMQRAYQLRAPGQKGIDRSAWGSFAGQLLLRTFDRAQRVYVAMKLRGFTGDYHTGDCHRVSYQDLAYLVGWTLFFIFARLYNIPMIMGSLFTGVR